MILFDYDKAKSGGKIKTKCGEEFKISSWSAPDGYEIITGFYKRDNLWFPCYWEADGTFFSENGELNPDYDLVSIY